MILNNIERHYSAFKNDLVKHFAFKKDSLFIDLTLGDGGHTQVALEKGCKVISFDVDSDSIARATNFLSGIAVPLVIDDIDNWQGSKDSHQWIIVKSNFTKVADVLRKLGLDHFDTGIVDLGPSQYQVLNEDRGFSFNSESELDMRIDTSLAVTAKDLLAVLNEGELRDLFELGDEEFSKPIARIIAKQRQITPITTCKQLSELVSRVKRGAKTAIHPATKVFMALRMAVNSERENITNLLNQLPAFMTKDTVFGVITFHSTEDRLVKNEIKNLESQSLICAINQKPITPSDEELKISPRTRSAKLRLIKKYN